MRRLGGGRAIAVLLGPAALAQTQGGRAYVVGWDSNTVSVIDLATDAVVATVPVGTQPMGVAVTPDATRVYVANERSDSVSVIDTATDAVVATVAVGQSPTPPPWRPRTMWRWAGTRRRSPSPRCAVP